MDAMTLCNNCDAADAVAGDPRGYCAECVAETDGPAKVNLELEENEIIILANALEKYAQTATKDDHVFRYMNLRAKVLDAWAWS